jgi:hypothetical protein
MMEVTFHFYHQGGQVRAYGPDVYDFTIKVSGPTEYTRGAFDRWAAWVVPSLNEPSNDWYRWSVREARQLGHNHWHYIIERPYCD